MHRNDAHPTCDVFGLNDMNDIAKDLKEFMMPGAHWNNVYSALDSALLYGASASNRMKARHSISKDSGEGGQERKELT